jgi:hypothetical protein
VAFKLTVLLLQSTTPFEEAFAESVGVIVSNVTFTTRDEFTQPLDGSVTVSVYTPAALTVPVAVLPGTTPLDQVNVAPLVLEFPCTVAVVLVQLIVAVLALTDALGTVVFVVTTTVELAAHPVAGSVTVRV